MISRRPSIVSEPATNHFEEFAGRTSMSELASILGREPDCLADYLQAWVIMGDGVQVCQGRFDVFLATCVSIADYWLIDPGVLDYASPAGQIEYRRLGSLLGRTADTHAILNPQFFAWCVQQHMHG